MRTTNFFCCFLRVWFSYENESDNCSLLETYFWSKAQRIESKKKSIAIPKRYKTSIQKPNSKLTQRIAQIFFFLIYFINMHQVVQCVGFSMCISKNKGYSQTYLRTPYDIKFDLNTFYIDSYSYVMNT